MEPSQLKPPKSPRFRNMLKRQANKEARKEPKKDNDYRYREYDDEAEWSAWFDIHS
jgi:hypothetical protein